MLKYASELSMSANGEYQFMQKKNGHNGSRYGEVECSSNDSEPFENYIFYRPTVGGENYVHKHKVHFQRNPGFYPDLVCSPNSY